MTVANKKNDATPFQPESLILRLPDELLLSVLEFLAPETPFHLRTDYEPYLSLPLTCRRFRHLYEPILYQALSLGNRGWDSPLRSMKLTRTLRERPDLCESVREVDIMLHNYVKPSEDAVSIIAKIIDSCSSNLRVVGLQGRWCSELLPVVQAIARCLCLERLFLGAKKSGPSVGMILKNFSLPRLCKLDIQCCGLSLDGENARLGFGEDTRSPEDRAVDMANVGYHLRPGSVAITTLKVCEPHVWPDAMEAFLTWPKHLTSFTLESQSSSGSAGYSPCYDFKYTLSAVQKIINCQKDSLRYIRLGQDPERAVMPDFRQFPCLKELHLSALDVMPPAINSMGLVARHLDAPSLTKLVIQFARQRDHVTATETLQESEITSLEIIAIRVAQLETIFLKLEPTFELHFCYHCCEWWPWKYIEVAAQTLQEHGADLICKKPSISLSEWQKLVKKGVRRQKRAAAGNAQYRDRRVAMEAREAAIDADQNIDDVGDFFGMVEI